jgi:PKD repeat protein
MKFSKIMTIMIVVVMIFTATSTVASARFSLRARLADTEEVNDKGVMRLVTLPTPFSVTDKEIYVIDVEKPVDIVKGVKGYFPINLDEFGDEFKEDGLEVEFRGKIVIFSVVSILTIKALLKGYVPIELTHIAKVEPDVNIPPKADFIWHPESPLVGEKVQFTDMSKDEDGEVVVWSWDFGDKNEYKEPNPVHVYEDAGVFEVRLIVTDDDGATGEVYHEIEVREDEPDPELVELTLETDPLELCSRDIFEYTKPNHETFPTDHKVHLFYEIGTEVKVHAKEIVGNYIFESWSGDIEEIDSSAVVIMDKAKSLCANYIYKDPDPDDPLPPVADFSYSPLSPTTEDVVQFNDMSIDPDGNIVDWWWEFDSEDQTSSEQNPTYKFEEPGLHRVTLTVTDNDGLTDFVWKEFEVSEIPEDNEPPKADFCYNPRTPTAGEPVEFNDKSIDDHDDIVKWIWDFGDGSRRSNEQNPTHIYEKAGEYEVTLVVYDGNGLPGKATKKVPVNEDGPDPGMGVVCGKVTEIGKMIPPRPIPGAKVALFGTGVFSLKPVCVTETDEKGNYKMEVEPGAYKVVVTANGYLPSGKEAKVKAGEILTVDFALLKIIDTP